MRAGLFVWRYDAYRYTSSVSSVRANRIRVTWNSEISYGQRTGNGRSDFDDSPKARTGWFPRYQVFNRTYDHQLDLQSIDPLSLGELLHALTDRATGRTPRDGFATFFVTRGCARMIAYPPGTRIVAKTLCMVRAAARSVRTFRTSPHRGSSSLASLWAIVTSSTLEFGDLAKSQMTVGKSHHTPTYYRCTRQYR